MLMRLRKKAQNTAEYAIVLGLVVGAVVAMQVYVKRNLQSRIKQFATVAPQDYVDAFNQMNMSIDKQYEPYYLDSDFNVTRVSDSAGGMSSDLEFGRWSDDTTTRDEGYQRYIYNNTTVEFQKLED